MWQRLSTGYPTHRAFYAADAARSESREHLLGTVDDWHLSYVAATGELYLGAPGGGEVRLLAVFPDEAPELVRSVLGDQRRWSRAELDTLLRQTPSRRRRLSPLAV